MNSGEPNTIAARSGAGADSIASRVLADNELPSATVSALASGRSMVRPPGSGFASSLTLVVPLLLKYPRLPPPSSSKGSRSSGRLPVPSAVAKLSRVIIESGFSHAS